MTLVDGVLDGTVRPRDGRSPFFAVPFFRTDFWPVTVAATVGLAIGAARTSPSAPWAGRRPMVDAPIVELEAEAGVAWLRLNRPRPSTRSTAD